MIGILTHQNSTNQGSNFISKHGDRLKSCPTVPCAALARQDEIQIVQNSKVLVFGCGRRRARQCRTACPLAISSIYECTSMVHERKDYPRCKGNYGARPERFARC